MNNPFDMALKYLRDDLAALRALDYRDDDPDVASCIAAIRVLEAAGRVDKEARESFDLFRKICRKHFFKRGIFGDRWARKFVIKDTLGHFKRRKP